MTHRQFTVWCRVSITAFVVGLAMLSPWQGVSAALPMQMARTGSRVLEQQGRAATLPAGLAAALQRALGHAHTGSAQVGPLIAPSRVFTWTQQAELTSSGSPYVFFGESVAISGDTALVGATNQNDYTGAAYVFVRSGSIWTEQAMLTANHGTTGDGFGVAVALNGDTALVGAPGTYQNHYPGAAYVFVRHGSTWTQQAEFTASDGVDGDGFGGSVSLDGNTALVGAYGKNNNTGAAYVYVYSGSTWIQQARLTASDGAAGDYFGLSVALNGGTALVGAHGKNNNTGAAYVFVQSGSVWSQQAEVTASDGAAGNQFGISVALNHGMALIGASGKNNGTGAAYVFMRYGSTSIWFQQAELAATPGEIGTSFGYSVALGAHTALIGAYSGPISGRSGAAYVFVSCGTTWHQQAILTASDQMVFAYFGFSVALSGGTALIGADGANSNAGAAYVFVRSGTGHC